jgi:hypothetical protein
MHLPIFVDFFILDWKKVITGIEKNPGKEPPDIIFFLQRMYLDSIR